MRNIVASRDNDVEPFEVVIRNRQRGCQFRTDIIYRFTDRLLREELRLRGVSLGIAFLGADAMAKANQQFLNHTGATDVITFDYPAEGDDQLSGELLICPAVAVEQAKEFQTSPASELIRYVVHGVLHLRGFDDLVPDARRLMKKEENRLVRRLEAWFPAESLEFRVWAK